MPEVFGVGMTPGDAAQGCGVLKNGRFGDRSSPAPASHRTAPVELPVAPHVRPSAG
jgi:hypothetical protein